jgi:hypothetical protein
VDVFGAKIIVIEELDQRKGRKYWIAFPSLGRVSLLFKTKGFAEFVEWRNLPVL